MIQCVFNAARVEKFCHPLYPFTAVSLLLASDMAGLARRQKHLKSLIKKIIESPLINFSNTAYNIYENIPLSRVQGGSQPPAEVELVHSSRCYEFLIPFPCSRGNINAADRLPVK